MIKRILENLAELLFPPTSLAGLGPVDASSGGYYDRQDRGQNHNAYIPGKYGYAARIGAVVEGPAAPVYKRGTRESRLAQRGL